MAVSEFGLPTCILGENSPRQARCPPSEAGWKPDPPFLRQALKEAFDAFCQYDTPRWAGWILKKWCIRALRGKLTPMKKFVGTLRNHEDLLMNYFKSNKLQSSSIGEGLNLRINLCMRKADGYRSFDLLQISLYHTLGDLPEPKFTHSFS